MRSEVTFVTFVDFGESESSILKRKFEEAKAFPAVKGLGNESEQIGCEPMFHKFEYDLN